MSNGPEKTQDTGKLAVGRGFLSQAQEDDGKVTKSPVAARARVVVVGAGLAGLAAAQRLHERGFSDVLVLDAQNRVGGRVHTIGHSDFHVELGAQWLHGAEDNPLHQWLTSLKMLDDFEDASSGFRGIFCTSDPGEEIDTGLVQRVLEILNESKSNLFNEGPLASGNKSAKQVFQQHLETSLAREPKLAANEQLVQALFKWFLSYETIENCCDHMDEVSVQSYTDWSDLGAGSLLNFKDGYQSLLAWLCEHFPRKQWLHLNKQVLNVELLTKSASSNGRDSNVWLDARNQANGSPVLVKYRDLSGSGTLTGGLPPAACDVNQINTIECQHVIVTVSLGFLKGHSKTFFTPPLPRMKQSLIDSIGFGTVNKIVLQFERPFWSAERGSIKLVWRDEDFVGADAFPAWTRDILAFDAVRRQPNLLIGWIGGQGAKTFELESDARVAEICLRILDKFLPRSHARPTRLVACLCSRWHSNPFICGSYSFQSMDSFGLNVDKLQEPIYCAQTIQSTADPLMTTTTTTTTTAPVVSNHLRAKFSADGNNNQLGEFGLASRVPRVMFAGEATAGKLYSTTHGAVISGWREADRLAEHLAIDMHAANVQQRVATECGPMMMMKV